MKKIWFINWWPGFDLNNNFFTNVIFDNDIEVTPNNPDIVISSVFGNTPIYLFPHAKKIWYTGENIRPQVYGYDLALSFDYNGGKNIRLPLYMMYYYNAPEELRSTLFDKSKNLGERDKFCAFIHSNCDENFPGVKYRQTLFDKLSNYKFIDAPGKCNKNVPEVIGLGTEGSISKIEYLKHFKFCFAIENQFYPGYVTEKILEPMLAGCIPIYAGSDRVTEEFNPRSFINANDFRYMNELVNKIIEIDSNDNLYNEMLEQPFVLNREIFNPTEVKNAIMNLF